MEGNMKKTKEYCEAGNKAAIECESKIKIFEAGYDFAMAQPKHIFDGVAQVGDVRRFEDELVDVVINKPYSCTDCIVFNIDCNCWFLTGCGINNVKYIKR